MTCKSEHYSTYKPCLGNKKITAADGTSTTVAGIGHIQVTPSLLLKNVLHVPKLSTNLLSVQKLTKDMSCYIIFSSLYCTFQDQNTGKKILLAREENGLYFLHAQDQSVPVKTPDYLLFFNLK